ncbi:MAG: hypothetical protein GC182_08955 [Rhodopseudomonas sp.]|nr:hypothetical protein [Rhodopseudomonas sp.]
MIHPTNGRIVWFTPGADFKGLHIDPAKPLAAMICHVWSDRMVNLVVYGSNGMAVLTSSVDLVQDEADLRLVKPRGRYAEWMPYQKGQAATTKHIEAGAGGNKREQ